MGVALGTLSGMSLALFSSPGAISEAFTSLIPGHSSAPDSAVEAGERAIWADNTAHPAKIQAADSGKRDLSANDSPSTSSTSDDSTADRQAKDQNSSDTQQSPTKSPAEKESPSSPVLPAKSRPTKPVINPFARTTRTNMASVPAIAIEPDGTKLSSSETQDKQLNSNIGNYSQFYVEGDFTVADYDSSEGTIEASDGRTFALGASVRENDAASWDEYRANVHYRCGENGTCTLTRGGTVTLEARLI